VRQHVAAFWLGFGLVIRQEPTVDLESPGGSASRTGLLSASALSCFGNSVHCRVFDSPPHLKPAVPAFVKRVTPFPCDRAIVDL